VVQKSTREGFGLTVTEAMWKGKAVIGGDTAVVMPEAPIGPSPGPGWLEVFTRRHFTAKRGADGRARLALGALLDSFPVALLLREPVGAG
jgi:hypothetical protein